MIIKRYIIPALCAFGGAIAAIVIYSIIAIILVAFGNYGAQPPKPVFLLLLVYCSAAGWRVGKRRFDGSPPTSEIPTQIRAPSAKSYFDLQCEFGNTEVVPGVGVTAIVLDARTLFDLPEGPVHLEADGRQLAVIRVAHRSGGYVVPAYTHGPGDPLRPDDLVLWVPTVYDPEMAEQFGQHPNTGWSGTIRAKISLVVPLTGNGTPEIISEYLKTD